MALNIALCDDIMGLIGEHVETSRSDTLARRLLRRELAIEKSWSEWHRRCYLRDGLRLFHHHMGHPSSWSPIRHPLADGTLPIVRDHRRALLDLEPSSSNPLGSRGAPQEALSHVRPDSHPRDHHLSATLNLALRAATATAPATWWAMNLQREEDRRRNSWNEWHRRNG
jgi:hypothetical protein